MKQRLGRMLLVPTLALAACAVAPAPLPGKESTAVRVAGGVSASAATSAAVARQAMPDAARAKASGKKEVAPPLADAGDILLLRGSAQVRAYANQQAFTATRKIEASVNPKPLPPWQGDFNAQRFSFAVGGQKFGLNELFEQHRTAGLLVLKEGAVAYERYGFGNGPETPWISFSVAKSVVSLLIGAAIEDGYIGGVDDPVVDYLPRLRGSAYESTKIRHLLQMASGVAWNEDYADPASDVAGANYTTLALYDHLKGKARVAPPGQRFNYNTAETNLAGTLLRSALGNTLSAYLEQKIWQPFGMEHDAYWNLTEAGGGEFGGCCINATLRDYARLGLFALGGGRLPDGTQVLPQGYLDASVASSKSYEGYGYFWWLGPGQTFSAQGIFGQAIYINPVTKVVIATHGAWDSADSQADWARLEALFAALDQAVSGPALAL